MLCIFKAVLKIVRKLINEILQKKVSEPYQNFPGFRTNTYQGQIVPLNKLRNRIRWKGYYKAILMVFFMH